jgi:hypothetical protein
MFVQRLAKVRLQDLMVLCKIVFVMQLVFIGCLNCLDIRFVRIMSFSYYIRELFNCIVIGGENAADVCKLQRQIYGKEYRQEYRTGSSMCPVLSRVKENVS